MREMSALRAFLKVDAGHIGGRRAVAYGGGDLAQRLFAAIARREHAGDGGGGILAGEYVAARVEGELIFHQLRLRLDAHGVPVGGELEYTDEVTLSRAFQGRREL